MVLKNEMNSLLDLAGKYTALYLAMFILLMPCASVAANKYPMRRGVVNDYANIIDSANASKMERLSREVLQKAGTAVVIATVATIGENEDVNFYANGLYKAWGIGEKGKDKGVLIFLAVKERKIRIETGYGVEGILPDGLVGEILDKHVVPHLKTGDYSKALYNAMVACSAIIARDAGVQLSGSPMPSKAKASTAEKGVSGFEIIVFLIVAVLLLGTKTGRSMLPWIMLLLLSGGRGGGGGGFSGGFGGFGGGGSGGGGAGR
ncbi:TPM domain-containing protein, partial [bacterium]|nr:TPM domain-containing protein [bacterium]